MAVSAAKASVVVLLATLLSCVVASGGLGAAATTVADGGDDPAQAESQLVSLINEFRANNGLAALHVNDALNRASRLHAANMAARGTLSHILDGKGPTERAQAAGFRGVAGGNIAAGDEGTGQQFFDLWVASPPHRANLLGPAYRELGVGCARSVRDGKLYCVAMFGEPR